MSADVQDAVAQHLLAMATKEVDAVSRTIGEVLVGARESRGASARGGTP